VRNLYDESCINFLLSGKINNIKGDKNMLAQIKTLVQDKKANAAAILGGIMVK